MHRILIIDDEKPARDFIAALVVACIPNAQVTKMSRPQKALACMQKEDYDMLFLDIRMPGMTGLELLEQVQRLGKNPFTVIISAYCEFDYAVKGIDLGVVKYIVKPLHKENIYEVLNMYLQYAKLNTLALKVPNGICRVEIEKILALEIADRGKITVHTTTGIIPCVSGTLSQLHQLLPPHFQYISRNCIINGKAITTHNPKTRETVIGELRFKGSRRRELRIEN